MSFKQFIRLTNLVINPRHIRFIESRKTKYIIHMNSNLDGIFGFSVFNFGFISGDNSNKTIEICSIKNEVDFLKLKEIIEN